jgi:hypothetical protein
MALLTAGEFAERIFYQQSNKNESAFGYYHRCYEFALTQCAGEAIKTLFEAHREYSEHIIALLESAEAVTQ